MKGIALATVGLWVILQTTFGPLATKLGLIAGSASSGTTPPGPTAAQEPTNNPQGVEAWQSTPPPPGAPPGQYRVDQNGNYEVNQGGQWLPYSLGSPGYTAYVSPTMGQLV